MIQVKSQNSEYVDYLINLQHSLRPYHGVLSSAFRYARQTLSNELIELNTFGVNEIAEGMNLVLNLSAQFIKINQNSGLRAFILIRDETEFVIENAVGSEQCINNALTSWPTDIERVGSDISLCADHHIEPVYNATEEIQLFLEGQNQALINIQNVVLSVISQVNPITDDLNITPTAEGEIAALYQEFRDTTEPELEALLQQIRQLKETVPIEIFRCVKEAIWKFDDEAMIIRNTIEFC